MTEAAVKLTKRAIDATPAPARETVLWDATVAGFGLKLTPAGARSYVLQYRMGGRGAATRRYTIGKHGDPWTVDQARAEALRLRALIADGVDPMAERVAARIAAAAPAPVVLTVADAFDRFRAQHLARKRSGDEMARSLIKDVLPIWSTRPLADIRRGDVIALLDAIEARGATYMRNRVHAHVRKFFAWAIQKDLLEANPADGVGKLDEQSRDRVLSPAELRAIWLACEGGAVHPVYASMIRLLILTAQRRDEVATMRWDEIDEAGAVWTIPKSKAKNGLAHDVPLPEAARSILRSMPRIGPYVHTTNGETSFSGFAKAKAALDKASGVTDWRVHDLRRTAATELAKMGIAQHVVEKLLNHKSGTITGVAAVYNRHDYRAERVAALDAWARRVGKLVAPDFGTVISLSAV